MIVILVILLLQLKKQAFVQSELQRVQGIVQHLGNTSRFLATELDKYIENQHYHIFEGTDGRKLS